MDGGHSKVEMEKMKLRDVEMEYKAALEVEKSVKRKVVREETHRTRYSLPLIHSLEDEAVKKEIAKEMHENG
jgi:hypothetical protein